MNCHYCHLPIADKDKSTTRSYWNGGSFDCHKSCKESGFQAEVIECQTIDADCNDCRHFKRGSLAPLRISLTKTTDGRIVEVPYQANLFTGTCLKFNKPTIAQPNKWSGHECFEHRKAPCAAS